jgi:prepilin-type N-terminal cleavage/methylation domain-containing protein/prepilin-type processing-associated H-X9-DG protein
MAKRIKRGFTLVELLVVITIIAILMALVVPTISSARQKANTTKCLAQLREWGGAVSAFQGDNEGVFPTTNWYATMAGYVGQTARWLPGGTPPRPGDGSIYSCPSSTTADFPGNTPVKIGYAMNDQIFVPGRNTGAIGVPALRRSHLAQPTRFVVLFDAKTPSAYGGQNDLFFRHGRTNNANVLFADGSVITVTNRVASGGKTLLWNPESAL